jgi:O-methyltransferase
MDKQLSSLVQLCEKLPFRMPLTWPELDWLSDKSDKALAQAFGEAHNLNCMRRQFLSSILKTAVAHEIKGDFVDIGVYLGYSTYLMHSAAEGSYDRQVHAFDSFEGMSDPTLEDAHGKWKRGDMAISLERYKASLARFNYLPQIHSGFIPDCFSEYRSSGRSIAVAHIDVDLYEPTRDALVFASGLLSRKGFIVSDDYGFSTCPGATKAVREFVEHSDFIHIPLPQGGALLFRPT